MLLAILWTICLIAGLVSMLMGNEPTWVQTLIPLFVLVIHAWYDYFKRGDMWR